MVSQQCLKQGLGLRASRSSTEKESSMGAEVSSAVGFALKIALVLLCQLAFFAKKTTQIEDFCFVLFYYKPEF